MIYIYDGGTLSVTEEEKKKKKKKKDFYSSSIRLGFKCFSTKEPKENYLKEKEKRQIYHVDNTSLAGPC